VYLLLLTADIFAANNLPNQYGRDQNVFIIR